jgi:Zn-dependent peptidase ImmA (M78 family)
MDFRTDKIDGRSITTDTGKFLIFINRDLSGDRQRYSLAHELGHIVCHLHSPNIFDIDIEKEAFLFASEFLMPEVEFKRMVGTQRITMQLLVDLKRYWKVSMQAILHWIETLKIATKNQARYLWSQFKSLRIKVKEPIEIPIERATLLSEIVSAFLNGLKYTKKQLADTISVSITDLEEYYLLKEGLRIVRA